MLKNSLATRWNPIFDDKPTIDVPRIRFSEKFSARYKEKRTLTLEIGCGTGSYTQLVDHRGNFGLDLDINAIKIAKKYCSHSEFIVASALNLPFKQEIFDLICIWGVFEEIPVGTEKQSILEVYRALMPNGIFVLSAYNDHIISKIFDPAFIFRGIRHYNPRQFLNLIAECGLIVNEFTVRGGLNTIIANFLFYFYKHVLKKKEAALMNFFNKKSTGELDSSKSGIVYMFIAAHKK